MLQGDAEKIARIEDSMLDDDPIPEEQLCRVCGDFPENGLLYLTTKGWCCADCALATFDCKLAYED